jgi:hypothetical protein
MRGFARILGTRRSRSGSARLTAAAPDQEVEDLRLGISGARSLDVDRISTSSRRPL